MKIAWIRVLLVHTGAVVLATTVLLEGVVAFSFNFPALSPIPVNVLKTLHQHFDRQVIQMMPECAQYDDRVAYTLRPGTCTFANREFNTTYHINSLGLRDDEASLNAPQVVVLGDSIAMGWGVAQEETFPAVLERLTGTRVLNAGISSYATARELRLLERIDRSRLEHLIIQYHSNDNVENEAFLKQEDAKVMSSEHYQRTVARHARSLTYFPGKYAFNVLVQLQSAIRNKITAAPQFDDTSERTKRDASLFISVILNSPVDLSSISLIVLSLDATFVRALHEVSRSSPVPWVRAITLIDASIATQFPEAFYVLDDHPTAAGQEAIGRLLADAINTRASDRPSPKRHP